MALAAIINQETYDKLSDELKKEYKKQDNGKFLLDVTPADDVALENVKGLKDALASERSQRETAERKLKSFGELDPIKAKEALKKVEELASGKLDDKTKEQIEAIKGQLAEKHKQELSAKDTEIERFRTAAVNSTRGRAITDALAKHKGAAYLGDTIEKRVKAEVGDNGTVTLKVVDPKGNARISPATGSQDLMTVDELVAEMKASDTYASAFEGTGATGSGAGTGSSGTGQARKPYTISRTDAKDPGKYRAAKAAAEKAGTQLQIID